MPVIRIVHAAGVGADPAGAVLEVTEDRARRLLLAGYAVAVDAGDGAGPWWLAARPLRRVQKE